MPNNHTMQKAQPEIFFSYAWGGEKEEVALNLYQHLLQEGFKVTIDRYDVGYKGSIVQFMKRMGRSSCIIVVLSDKYLKSPYCMFELLEIYRKSNSDIEEMLAKIYPVVMNDADILTTEGILNYVRYWEQKATSLKNEMKDIELEFVADLVEDFKTRHEIALNMGLLTKLIKNIKTLNPQSLQENNYETIKKAIREKGAIQPPNGLPHHLTAPPFISEVFFGRVEELAEIHTKLFEGDNLLLLVNGMGGVGKTTLATHYYYGYANEYAHLAWVLSEKSITNALLLLAVPLGLRFEDTMPTEARLQVLLAQMANLNKPCLLVIDNANELEDLQANYMALRSCPNFHLLLTTRIDKFEKAPVCKIGALPYDTALELFTEHYTGHDAAEDELFKKVYEAVEGNTLIIELLAKNLYVQNLVRSHYTLSELVTDLQKGLLSISKTKPVSTHYHSDTLLKGEPLDIIAAMYDIGELSAPEKRLLSNLAVLPAENIPFAVLESLLPDTPQLEETLVSLSLKGWIEHNQFEAAFKISPVIQEITRAKNTDLLGDCRELIDKLIDGIDYEGDHLTNESYKNALQCARYGEALANCFTISDHILAMLIERVGTYHSITGNLPKALTMFRQYKQMQEQLCNEQPTNILYKYNLGVTYEKLGVVYADMGNLTKALQFYELYSELAKQLFDEYPDNADFKSGLATSYQFLGNANADMGNLDKSLQFYELCSELSKQLFNDYPDNVNYKNKLAISYQFLAYTHENMGNLPKALELFEQYNYFRKQLFDDHPYRVDFKSGLAISFQFLGNIYTSLGNLTKALQLYEQQATLFQQLLDNYPNNIWSKHGLATAYEKLGNTYASLDNLPEAVQFYELRLALGKQLFDDYPDNVAFKNGLAISYGKLGQTYATMGNLPKALQFYEDQSMLAKQLFDDYPDNVGFKNGLAVSFYKLGTAYEANGDMVLRSQYLQQAQVLWQQLVVDFPDYAEFGRNLGIINDLLEQE